MHHQQVTVSAEDQSILHLLSLLAVGAAGLSDGGRNEQKIPRVSPMLGTGWGENGFGVWKE